MDAFSRSVDDGPCRFEQLERRLLFALAYTVQDLGTLGGDFTVAHDINEHGLVVGGSRDGLGSFPAFLWSAESGMVALTGTDGQLLPEAAAINDRGQVVGGADRGTAYVYSNGSVKKIFMPRCFRGRATGINNNGLIVGDFESRPDDPNVPFTPHVFAYDASGLHDLGHGLGADVNDAGLIISGLVTENTRPGGFQVYEASALNERGVTVDTTVDIQGITLVAREAGGATGRQRGLVPPPTITSLHVSGINNADRVVGSFGLGKEDRAYVLDNLWSGTILRDLNELIPPDSGWTLEGASAINDKGQIVGNGIHNGEHRAFLLTPIPGAEFPTQPNESDVILKEVALPKSTSPTASGKSRKPLVRSPFRASLKDGVLSVIGTRRSDIMEVSILNDPSGSTAGVVLNGHRQELAHSPGSDHAHSTLPKRITIRGRGGDDQITVNVLFDNQTVFLDAGAGDDRVQILSEGYPATVMGGNGNDQIELLGRGQTFVGQQLVQGGAGDDTLRIVSRGGRNITDRGPNLGSTLLGEAGDDRIFAGGTNDLLDGGDGNDTLWGGGGNDTALGALGNDKLVGGNGADTLDGGPGKNTLFQDSDQPKPKSRRRDLPADDPLNRDIPPLLA